MPNETPNSPIHARALRFHLAGVVAIPARQDGTKAPAVGWKRYQSEPPSVEQLAQWFGHDAQGVGVVTGAVSGHLEMVELEGRAVAAGMRDDLAFLAGVANLGWLLELVDAGYSERTPSGGIHWLYKVEQGGIGGNQKLAQRPNADGGIDVLAETRAEGGFCITAPSGGSVHPSGKPWEQLRGGPETIADITIEERNMFLDLFRRLDRMPKIRGKR